MPSEYPFYHFMDVYQNTYQTIDLRVALVNDKDKWNVLGLHILIKVSHVQTVMEDYQRIALGRKIDTNKIKIIQKSFPFSDYQMLKLWLINGKMELDDLPITFNPVSGIHGLNSRIECYNCTKKTVSLSDWPVIRASTALSADNPYYQLVHRDLEMVRDIECAGFVNIDDAIKTLLGMDYSSSNTLLAIDVDIPARILSIVAEKHEKNLISFEVSMISHCMLTDFVVNITSFRSSDKRYFGQITMQPTQKSNDMQKWGGSYTIENIFEKNDEVEFVLIHKKIGYIGTCVVDLNQLYKDEVRNPLLHALSYFCPLTDFRNMILKAKGKPVIDLKSDKKYEVTIQWLLSVAGFQSIWLNKHEELNFELHQYGTVDCLAYSEKENMLLFVNCTLGNPNEKELLSYREVLHFFTENVFTNATLKLFSVVFSNAQSPATVRRRAGHDESIIFYRSQIDELFELIINGQEHELVRYIQNAPFSALGVIKA